MLYCIEMEKGNINKKVNCKRLRKALLFFFLHYSESQVSLAEIPWNKSGLTLIPKDGSAVSVFKSF
jgi:hypothetical protein